MGTLTRADYARRVLLALGNTSDAHPMIVEGVHLTAIDNAPNRLIRQNPDLFPDHQNRSFTIGPTIAGENRITIPRHLLIIDSLRRSDNPVITTTGNTNAGVNVLTGCADTSLFDVGDFVSASAGLGTYRRITAITATTITLNGVATSSNVGVTIYLDPGDWSSTQALPMSPVSVSALALMTDSEESSFPYLYGHKVGNSIVYWPTTDADTTCWFRAIGVSGEEALSDDDDRFMTESYWDTSIVFLAASETAEMIGMTERATELLAMANQRIESTINPTARERAKRPIAFRPAGMSRW